MLTGRKPNEKERRLWNKLAGIGCIACRIDGIHNPIVSIHHIDGRTKEGCHRLVLPLCAGHHQQGCGAPFMIAVHPHKARFERAYGDQRELNAILLRVVEEGHDLTLALELFCEKHLGAWPPVRDEEIPF